MNWKPVILKQLWRIPAPFVVPIMLLFMRRTDRVTTHHNQRKIPRYRLPKCFRFAETPDEDLPGGLYEPTVRKIYDTVRKVAGERVAAFITGWYWIGWRNVGHGITWPHGKPVSGHIEPMSPDQREAEGIFRITKTWRPFKFIYGYKVVRDWYGVSTDKGGYWAVPTASLRLK